MTPMTKVCEEIAVVCDLSEPPTEKAMSRRLRKLGLTARGGCGGGKAGRKATLASAGSRSKVPQGLLKQLYEEFKGHPDALNQVGDAGMSSTSASLFYCYQSVINL